MDKRKRTPAWHRGQTDGYYGVPPDCGQATARELQDYLVGHKLGRLERAKEKAEQ